MLYSGRLRATIEVMDQLNLLPHPDLQLPHGFRLSAVFAMVEERLTLEFCSDDPANAILWPATAQGRTDNLWQHSCFEAFIGSTTSPAYAEFNLAPSGAWAAYAFDDYRAGMRDLMLAAPPHVTKPAPGIWRATLALEGLDALIGPPPWRLALTAVIEAKDGAKSYWSLAHPPGKPDFHHADCFAARLG